MTAPSLDRSFGQPLFRSAALSLGRFLARAPNDPHTRVVRHGRYQGGGPPLSVDLDAERLVRTFRNEVELLDGEHGLRVRGRSLGDVGTPSGISAIATIRNKEEFSHYDSNHSFEEFQP